MYLPKKTHCTRDWFKAVLKDEKKLIPIANIKSVIVPCYPELSLKKLLPEILNIPEVMTYMPHGLEKKMKCDRQWFFDILATILPGYVEKLVTDA